MEEKPALAPGTTIILVLGFLTALATLATAGVGLYVAVDSNKVAVQNKEDIERIHISINSRMDELLEVTRAKARAEGVIEGESNQ